MTTEIFSPGLQQNVNNRSTQVPQAVAQRILVLAKGRLKEVLKGVKALTQSALENT